MAQATSIRHGLIAVLIGDGGVNEVFSAPCGLTQITITTNVETQTTNIPDCDDPETVAWLAIDEISRQMAVSGSGILAQESFLMWENWNLAGGKKNVRVFHDLQGAVGGGYYQGAAVLNAYEKSGSRNQRWNMSFGITFDGKPTFVPAA